MSLIADDQLSYRSFIWKKCQLTNSISAFFCGRRSNFLSCSLVLFGAETSLSRRQWMWILAHMVSFLFSAVTKKRQYITMREVGREGEGEGEREREREPLSSAHSLPNRAIQWTLQKLANISQGEPLCIYMKKACSAGSTFTFRQTAELNFPTSDISPSVSKLRADVDIVSFNKKTKHKRHLKLELVYESSAAFYAQIFTHRLPVDKNCVRSILYMSLANWTQF